MQSLTLSTEKLVHEGAQRQGTLVQQLTTLVEQSGIPALTDTPSARGSGGMLGIPLTPDTPVISSQNPFIHGFLPQEDETPLERAVREQEEVDAKAVSDAIDEQIMRDEVTFKRYQGAIKVLFLGQSGSGQFPGTPDRMYSNSYYHLCCMQGNPR